MGGAKYGGLFLGPCLDNPVSQLGLILRLEPGHLGAWGRGHAGSVADLRVALRPARALGERGNVRTGARPQLRIPGEPQLTSTQCRCPLRVLRVCHRPLGTWSHLAVDRGVCAVGRPRPRPCARRSATLLHHSVSVGHGKGRGRGHGDAPAADSEQRK